MTPRERFLTLLKNDILKLDLAELNFGIYRILNARRDLVLKFLDQELPELIERQLASLPGTATEDEEARIYAALDTFFHRYWDDGDFILRPRRGRDATYSVPYDGSDVYFHWATKGSHYVKSGEFLKAYAFKPEGAGGEVRFEVVAAQQEKDNVKGAKRYFVPSGKAQDGAALVIQFEFRPLTDAEAKKYDVKGSTAKVKSNGGENGNGEENGGGQLAPSKVQDRLLRAWLEGTDFKNAAVPAALRGAAFEKHVARYVRKQTSDFFVHPQLGPFLEGELDYFLKNEFLQLWDRATPEALARERAKFNIIRDIGKRIIAFLHQIEDFQARLFEKRKFILKTDWLVMASALAAREGGKALVEKAAADKNQVAEWRRWVGDNTSITGKKLLEKYPHLPIHTIHFEDEYVMNVLGCFEDIEEALGGVLINGENYGALRTLQTVYDKRINFAYIDPPYNTEKDDFAYKDGFQHSSWCSMLEHRAAVTHEVLSSDGALFVSIDEKELSALKEVLQSKFGKENIIGELVWRNARDNNPTRLAVEHEYIVTAVSNTQKSPQEWKSSLSAAKDSILNEYERLKGDGLNTEDIQRELRKFLKDNSEFVGELERYKFIDDDGPYTGSESVHNPHPGGYRYNIKHPITKKAMRIPANGYRFPEETMRRDYIAKDRLLYGPDENRIVKIKLYLMDYVAPLRSVMDLDGRLGAYAMGKLFGDLEAFKNPKPVELIKHLAGFSSNEASMLDFYAGSGTTAHAAIELNREDGGKRRFILVEQQDYFDTTIVPRTAKLITCPDWKDGKPNRHADMVPKRKADAPNHWSARGPVLVKVARLEHFDDSLDALETRDEYEARRAGMQEMAGQDYVLRYLLEEETRGSALFAPGRLFEAPFSAQLPVHTPGGVKLVPIDLAESTLAMLGLRLTRVFEETFEKRRYRIMAARTRTDELQLVVLRDLSPVPKKDFWKREYEWLVKTVEQRWKTKLPAYARIWYNGDTLLLGGETGSSIDAEFARVMQERDPHAAAA